ncbi:hypothetical protein BD847_0024 [Flavobacterium cutihirudinis]|uniref:Cytoskeletal protein CcmA (Bactofilin family) n=1 Tax=Flavobacterium cutihirudinis TaxID=1265740 RepID=A0A3D9FYU0_9FLAO|nr:hypothetical protein [Flavobacterium cutihirudinis]RED26118.1 hypothetical protein BD847_0024 [Flavobacterium cutihirudinis]
MKLKFRIKSGALQFTVFIAVLIALLLAGIVLYAYTFIYMKEQSKGAIENIQIADIGIQSLLEQKEINTDTTTINFIEKDKQIIKTNLSTWGIFQKGISNSQFRKKKFIKTALIGTLLNANKSPTVFLQDSHNTLSVVGTTSIKGIAYLPFKQAKSGYIAGNNYYGSQLIYGKIEKSSAELPPLSKTFENEIKFYFQEYKPSNQHDYINLNSAKKITNSFNEKTKGFYSENPIILDNVAISGNIIIKSETAITVKNTSKLKDLILIAPLIEIEAETIGNFQAIATKKITVGENCNLEFPSALLLFQDSIDSSKPISNDISTNNDIFINTGTTIKGSVVYYQTKESSDFRSQITLEKNARIKGQVYCNGNFEIKGIVSGSVITKQFVANQSGSIFINHVFNATIENENIPELYGGIILEKQPKTVLKWLY